MPDSQKSGMDKTKDKASGGMDSVAGSMQPDSMKSGSQKAGDKSSSMYEQTKDAVSNTFSSDNSRSLLSCRQKRDKRSKMLIVCSTLNRQAVVFMMTRNRQAICGS